MNKEKKAQSLVVHWTTSKLHKKFHNENGFVLLENESAGDKYFHINNCIVLETGMGWEGGGRGRRTPCILPLDPSLVTLSAQT